MFSTLEQFVTANKAYYEAQFETVTALTRTTFDSVTKVIDLNLTTAKISLAESAAATRQLLSSTDPQDVSGLMADRLRQRVEKTLAYNRDIADIASSVQAELTRITETHITKTSRRIIALLEDATKNAPAGSEKTIALVKSAIDQAHAGYAHLNKTTQQAVGVLEGHLTTAANQFPQAVEKMVSGAGRK